MKRLNAFLSLLLSVIMIATSFPLGVISAERVASDSVTGPTARAGSIDNDLLQSSKTVSYNGDGTYTLKMEGYATASAIPKHTDSVVPVDVAIVIDHSGSQDQCVQCDTDLSGWTKMPYYAYKGQYDTSKVYYIDNDNAIYYCNDCAKWFSCMHYFGYHGGTEYLPARNNDSHNSIVQFYTAKNGTAVYNLDKNSSYYAGGYTVVYCPTCDGWFNGTDANKKEHGVYNSNPATDHNGSYIFYPMSSASDTRQFALFKQKTNACSKGGECVTKFVATQKAIANYLDLLYSSAIGPDGSFGTGDDLSHRVALIDYYSGSGDTTANARYLTVKNSSGEFVKKTTIDSTSDATEIANRELYAPQALKSLSNANDRKAIGEGLAYVHYANGCYPDNAMLMTQYAFNLDANKSACDNGQRKRVVIFIGDTSDGSDLTSTIKQAKVIKDMNNSYVFSYGVMGTYVTDPTGNVGVSTVNSVYQSISSNFPSATGYKESARGTVNSIRPGCGSYYHAGNSVAAMQTGFAEIFNESVNGLTTYTMNGTNSYMQDVVSSNFTVQSATAYSMKYSGGTSWTTTGGTTYSPSISGNTVKVSGFDYTANWVGTTVKGKAQGQKLVLEVVISPKTPGNALATNTQASSGIYHNSNGMQEMFDLPKADVPATVTFATSCGTQNLSVTASAVKTGYSVSSGSGNSATLTTASSAPTVNINGGSIAGVKVGSTVTISDVDNVTATNASVSKNGTTYTVTVNGNSVITVTKHSYSSTVTAPTCTAQGYTTHTCACGTSYKDTYTAATDHSYSSEVTTAATCTTAGVRTYTCSKCGHSYTEAIAATGHSYTSVVTEPTCTAQGYTTYTCSKCQHSYKDNYTEANGHSWNEGVIDPDSTCTEEGVKTYTCGVCGETKTEAVSAKGHTEVIDAAVEPTCTETGLTEGKHCSVCKAVIIPQQEIPALDHSFTNYISNNDATCTEDGTKTAKCDRCDETNTVTDEGSALGHDEIAHEAQDPTCTEIGWDAYVTCSRCDYTTYVEKSALGHDEIVHEEQAPTCTEIGWDAYVTCSRCDYTTYVEKTALGHKYDAVVTDPTCTEDGYTTYTCTVCGDSYVDDKIEADGHKYEGTVTEPTCTETGYTTYTCSVCNDTYVADETDALGHSWDEGVIDPDSTCTEEGVKTYTCGVCGETKTEAVSAKGHTEVIDVAVEPTCTETGLTEGKHCSVCGAVIVAQEVIPALDHSFTDYKSNNNATCTEDGTKTAKCDRCDVTDTVTDEGSKLGHNYVGVVTDPTCTEDGYTTYTCTRCNDSYVADEVDALGHTEVIDAAVAPTCTETGLTEGKHCSVCNEVLVAQTVVAALGHTEVIDAAVAPTCTETGLTEGKHCSVCNEVLVAQTVVAALGHTEVVDAAVAPTCTETGLTEGKHCSVCNEVLVAQTVVDALGHTEAEAVIENNVDPDCENTGSYDLVVYCSICDEELSRETKTVDALGHSYDAVVTSPTCTEKGYTTYTCSECNDTYTDNYVDATNHVGEETYVLTVIENGNCYEITYCCRCDAELVRKLIDPVAQNVETGKYYTTLEAALVEVTAGDTVKLLDNVTVDDLNAPIAGYIDLNGHVLEAYTLSVGTSTHIVDSSAGNEGYLVVGSADQTINSSNCDMPVYVSYTDEDGTVKDGYRFFDSVKLQQLTPEFTEDVKTGSRFVSVTFRHIIGDAATSNELFGDGALDNGIKLGVTVKVTKADGETSEELYWICSDELIASAYTNGNAIKVTITGIEAYETITIGSVLISEKLGVEMTTYEKNGKTYSTIGTYDIATGTAIEA